MDVFRIDLYLKRNGTHSTAKFIPNKTHPHKPHLLQCCTLFCRSVLAPAFCSSETFSVQPFLTAIISAESPSCVMTDMCSETQRSLQNDTIPKTLSTSCIANKFRLYKQVYSRLYYEVVQPIASILLPDYAHNFVTRTMGLH